MRAMDQDSQDEAAPKAPRHRWIPRNVKITLMVLFLFFVGEYILLPELATLPDAPQRGSLPLFLAGRAGHG